MARIQAGDRVQIIDREATPQDLKSGLYFPHYGGLHGQVQKVYGQNEVAVEVDLETLPEAVWKRHMDARDQMRRRWLDGLPEEQRRKLTPEQKEFRLRYVVLVAQSDLRKPRQKQSVVRIAETTED